MPPHLPTARAPPSSPPRDATWQDSERGKDARAGPSTLSRPADCSKLKKHITLVADRLHKGLRPTKEKEGGTPAAPATVI